MFKKNFSLFILIFISSFLFAEMGPDVSRLDDKDLKWENSKSDYFIMFNSLIKNNNRTQCVPSSTVKCNLGDDNPFNPQADACIKLSLGSTFKLVESHVPHDADVQAAYLIWVSALPSDKIPDGITDNKVTLSFKNSENTEQSAEISATKTEKTVNDWQDFSFSAVESIDPVNISCTTDEECASSETLDEGWTCEKGACATHTVVYTYRADVTSFFKDLQKAEIQDKGSALIGQYTVSNMDCTNDPAYLTTSGMVGGWAIVFVYKSDLIKSKNIYIYDGFDALQFEESIIPITGLDLPEEAQIRLSIIAFEGDTGLASATTSDLKPAIPENLSIKGQTSGDFDSIWNTCNPPRFDPLNYTEVFNSISSTYGWDSDVPSCIGGDPNSLDPEEIEYAVDVDTFLLKSTEFPFDQHLKKGDSSFSLKIGANQDQIYTNLLIVSVDTYVEDVEDDDSDDLENDDNDSSVTDDGSVIDDSSSTDDGSSINDENEVSDNKVDETEESQDDDNTQINNQETKKSSGCSIVVF